MSKQVDKAKEIIYGDRERTYGHPSVNLKRIANYWSTHLGIEVTPVDVCDMMILMKLARLANDPDHEDSRVDIHGYNMLTERLKETDDFPTQQDSSSLHRSYLTPLRKAIGESNLNLGQKIALIRIDFMNPNFAEALFKNPHKTGSDMIDKFLDWSKAFGEGEARRIVRELKVLSVEDTEVLRRRVDEFCEALECRKETEKSAPTSTLATVAPTTSLIV